jgi:hypothetical protein
MPMSDNAVYVKLWTSSHSDGPSVPMGRSATIEEGIQ